MSKELVIDKNTKLNQIENKEEYDKLVIKTKVNPKKLNEFYNVKELEINYLPKRGNVNYNERYINLLPFKKNLEKLTFKNIYNYGSFMTGSTVNNFELEEFNNLKVIEFPSTIKNIENDYLNKVYTLDTIIFNLDENTSFLGYVKVNASNLKTIILKYCGLETKIDLDYEVEKINQISWCRLSEYIEFRYEGSEDETTVSIDLKTNVMKKINSWSNYGDFDTKLFIPDYVTEIDSIGKRAFSEISLNLKLLDSQEDMISFVDANDYYNLDKIILRSNNYMQLIPKKVIKPKEYGKLKDLYIEAHLLKLEYDSFTISIDSKGNIEKTINEVEIIEEVDDTIDLDKYTLEELEEYVSYLKLLKLSNGDKEYNDAMKIVREKVLKKLKK